MKQFIIPAMIAASFIAMPASAQSNDELLGAAIGGSLGAVVGGELDNKGSKKEGQIIGAIIGGTAGYAIADDNKNENRVYTQDRYQESYYPSNRISEPVYIDGVAYNRVYDSQGNHRLIAVQSDNRVYTSGKSHPVHATHPGRGHGVKKFKNKYK